MKNLNLVLASASLLLSPVAALANIPQRASATYYVAPAPVNTAPAVSLKGQSTTTPAVVQGYAKEAGFTDSWAWEEQRVFAAPTLVYAGYRQGRLINVVHFLHWGDELRYVRQYVIHYAPGGASITVQRYDCEHGSAQEAYDGETVYTSRLESGKLYLTSVDRFSKNGTKGEHMNVEWTANGVRASVAYNSGNFQELALKANGTWLAQNFDMWDDFGLKFQ
ncbi:MAG TPA: hypothetical protein V6C97_26905 [Oculatellaceae cyanobacterium]